MIKKISFGLILFFLVIILFVVIDFHLAAEASDIEPMDLSPVLAKESFTEEDYEIIFQQTGLGPLAVDDLKAQSEAFALEVKKFQEQQFAPLSYGQRFLFFPTTTAEQLQDENKEERMLMLPPLKAGDILITKSTKTLLYRHGHAALVLDPERKTTMEALMLGEPSAILNVDNWCSYPTLLVLRPKNLDEETVDGIIRFARQRLLGAPYSLLTGVIQKDKSTMEQIDRTHCAHLVWQAYRQAGMDIDVDGGWLVTPHDIAGSPMFSVVFSYGFGLDGAW